MKVLFHKRFDKSFAKLPTAIQQKTVERLAVFRLEPYAQVLNNHALSGKWTGYRSINVTGDYRGVYFPEDEDNAKFYVVKTHSQLYG